MQAETAGFLYQAVLREELSTRLGVDWEPVENGAADLRGVSRGLIDRFSTRRREILEAMQARGEHSARAAQVATLDTRRGKTTVAVADQREDWRRTAGVYGLAARSVEDAQALAPDQTHQPPSRAEIQDHLLGPEGLTAKDSSFDRGQVLRALAGESRRGARVGELERRADALLTDPRVVRLEHGRYSTRELIGLERRLLDQAERSREPAAPVTSGELVRATSARSLSMEQAATVEQIVRGPGGIQVVRAPAGTGKTFALDAAREAWQAAGVPVLGCALSARAACELRDQAAMDATTIARLRMGLREGARLAEGSVLIVDEAGMVGTRDLPALSDAASQSRARLNLVGDDRQLPEIDAGGAFGALARQGPTCELREVRRQHEPWDRDALNAPRAGDLEAFARAYTSHDRVITSPDAPSTRARLVEDWWQATNEGSDALMLAHRRGDVADLNHRARHHMREAGHLGPDTLECPERSFAVGDRVLTTRNDRGLDVINGQTGVLAAVDEHGLTLQLSDGRELELPAGYAQANYLDHGYAMTAHRAQGATVDQTFVLGSDELSREWGYTALSRHRQQARFYTSAQPAFVNQPAPALIATDDVEHHVIRALSRSDSKQTAESRHAMRREEELDSARRRVERAEERLEKAAQDRARTSRLRRHARTDLNEREQVIRIDVRNSREDLDKLHKRLNRKHANPAPDPLAIPSTASRSKRPVPLTAAPNSRPPTPDSTSAGESERDRREPKGSTRVALLRRRVRSAGDVRREVSRRVRRRGPGASGR